MESNIVDLIPTYKLFASTVSLTTSYLEGQGTNVMANEWMINVCWEPLRVMVVIHQDNLTHEFISLSKEFGVNLCSVNQANLAHFAGNISGRECDKLADSLFSGRVYPATHIRAPMIDGCVLNAECIVEDTMKIGDYTGFLGLALCTRQNRNLHPLLYHRGRYYRMGDRILKPGTSSTQSSRVSN